MPPRPRGNYTDTLQGQLYRNFGLREKLAGPTRPASSYMDIHQRAASQTYRDTRKTSGCCSSMNIYMNMSSYGQDEWLLITQAAAGTRILSRGPIRISQNTIRISSDDQANWQIRLSKKMQHASAMYCFYFFPYLSARFHIFYTC